MIGTNEQSPLVEQHWPDVAEQVRALKPELADIIDSLNPDQKHSFFRLRYNFGDEIVQRGKLFLPTEEGELISIDDPKIPCSLRDRLNYNAGSNPATFVLSGQLELLFHLTDRIIPFSLIKPGNLFGLWKSLDTGPSNCPETFLWELTAGARSLFMLPKISQAGSHARLKKSHQITADKPTTINDHWNIFKGIANSKAMPKKWQVELLFFSTEWFEHKTDPAWRDFNYLILDSAWQSSGYWRNQYIWDLVLSDIQNRRNIRYSPYIIGIARHMLRMGCSAMPGFQPANDNSLGPIDFIQQTYIESYNLKHYAPIIMQPAYFSCYQPSDPVYYSLQHPATISYAPKASKHSTTLQDLYEVGSVLKKYVEEIKAGKVNIAETPLESVAIKTEITLIHNNTSNYRNIEPASIVPEKDAQFLTPWINTPNNNLFPPNSLFFNGALSLSRLKEENPIVGTK